MQHQTAMNCRTIISADEKLTWYRGHTFGELTSLSDDPGEVCNLWSHPDKQASVARMLTQILELDSGIHAPTADRYTYA